MGTWKSLAVAVGHLACSLGQAARITRCSRGNECRQALGPAAWTPATPPRRPGHRMGLLPADLRVLESQLHVAQSTDLSRPPLESRCGRRVPRAFQLLCRPGQPTARSVAATLRGFLDWFGTGLGGPKLWNHGLRDGGCGRDSVGFSQGRPCSLGSSWTPGLQQPRSLAVAGPHRSLSGILSFCVLPVSTWMPSVRGQGCCPGLPPCPWGREDTSGPAGNKGSPRERAPHAAAAPAPGPRG